MEWSEEEEEEEEEDVARWDDAIKVEEEKERDEWSFCAKEDVVRELWVVNVDICVWELIMLLENLSDKSWAEYENGKGRRRKKKDNVRSIINKWQRTCAM